MSTIVDDIDGVGAPTAQRRLNISCCKFEDEIVASSAFKLLSDILLFSFSV